MYTLPKDYDTRNITPDEVSKIINYNKKFEERYKHLYNYYMGIQSICNRKKESAGRRNNKVVVNHAKYITDTCVGYLLGNPVDYQVKNDSNGDPIYDLEPVLSEYKKQTINDIDSEIAKNVSILGLQYEYIYINEEAAPRSCLVDNEHCIIVYDDTVEHKKLFAVLYRPIYKGDKLEYWDVVVIDKKTERHYHSTKEAIQQVEGEKPHIFGDVPVIMYKNNPELLGDFEPVISLIDAYNLLQSDRVNDKEQLVDAILCMYGIDFDSEQADMLRESRMLANIPTDGRVEYLSKNLQETDVDILRQVLEADIHKISMVPNMADREFANNSSGVAIRYKLLAFEQHVKNKERYFEKGLVERFKLYNTYLATKSQMQLIPIEEIDVTFKRNLPSNDFEISQMICNLADFVDRETLVSQLSFIKDASEIVEMKEKEDNAKMDKYEQNFIDNEIPDANEEQEEGQIKQEDEEKKEEEYRNKKKNLK